MQIRRWIAHLINMIMIVIIILYLKTSFSSTWRFSHGHSHLLRMQIRILVAHLIQHDDHQGIIIILYLKNNDLRYNSTRQFFPSIIVSHTYPWTLPSGSRSQKCTVRGWRPMLLTTLNLLCPTELFSPVWPSNGPGRDGTWFERNCLGWDISTTGHAKEWKYPCAEIARVRQFVLYHDNEFSGKQSYIDTFHTPSESFAITLIDSEELWVFGDGVYTSTTFSYSAQETILSSWSQWSQTHPSMAVVARVLVGNYTTGQQGMKVPLWKMTKSDLIQWQIPSTHPHN